MVVKQVTYANIPRVSASVAVVAKFDVFSPMHLSFSPLPNYRVA